MADLIEPNAEDIKLFISVISARQWPARFGESLAGLTLQLGLSRLGGRLKGLNMTIARQAHPSITRNDHLTQAIAEGFTHFLSLDDDQTFPGDVVERMLLADKPVVTANYRKKTMERVEYVCSDLGGEMLDSTHRTGLERCKAMGMGMALIRVADIADIPQPRFAVIWNRDDKDGAGGYLIEDAFFSLLLWERGIELWCDHDLSRDIGHVGEYEYRLPPLTLAPLALVEPSQKKVA